MCVFGAHTSYIFANGNVSAWQFGQLGVMTFFVHTSLVLMMSMERLYKRSRGKDVFRRFYALRMFRIYPLAVAWVLVAFIADFNPALGGADINWGITQLVTNVTLSTNLFFQSEMVGGLWSLPLEVQMYLVLPFLFLFLKPRTWWWALVIWGICIPVAYFQKDFSGRLTVLRYAPCFMGGLIAWRLMRRTRPELPGFLWPLAIAATTLIWLGAPHSLSDPSARAERLLRSFGFCCALGLAVPLFRDMADGVVTRVCAVIAKYSYSIYLSHLLIINTVFFRVFAGSSPWIQWPAFVALSVVVPFATYQLIEAPFIRIGRQYAYRDLAPEVSVRPVITAESVPTQARG
jgi:peptidoglycan/LPS O-acetylase OafA/YrhL